MVSGLKKAGFGRRHRAAQRGPHAAAAREVDLPSRAGRRRRPATTGSVWHAWLKEVARVLPCRCPAKGRVSREAGAALGTRSTAPALRAPGTAGQEPSASDRRFLASLPRVPTSDPLVFVQAPRGQASAGGDLAPPLGAGQASLMPRRSLCSTRLPSPTQD